MFHGGTNFGFMASRLVATSHDWDAPVHESGSRDTLKYRGRGCGRSMQTEENRSDSSGRRRAEKELFGIGWRLLINGCTPGPGGSVIRAAERSHTPATRSAAAGSAAASRSATHLSLKRSQLAAPTNTLDLIVENLGRSSSSSVVAREATLSAKASPSLNAEQLQAPGRLLINEQPVPSYKIYSLRLDAAFMAKVAVRRSSWLSVSSAAAAAPGQPGLYRASLRLMDEPLADTYLDMSAWRKGSLLLTDSIWADIGPRRGRKGHCTCAAPLLRRGDNELGPKHAVASSISSNYFNFLRQPIRSTRGLWEQLNQLERLLPAALLQSRRHLSLSSSGLVGRFAGGPSLPSSLAATNSGPWPEQNPALLTQLGAKHKQETRIQQAVKVANDSVMNWTMCIRSESWRSRFSSSTSSRWCQTCSHRRQLFTRLLVLWNSASDQWQQNHSAGFLEAPDRRQPMTRVNVSDTRDRFTGSDIILSSCLLLLPLRLRHRPDRRLPRDSDGITGTRKNIHICCRSADCFATIAFVVLPCSLLLLLPLTAACCCLLLLLQNQQEGRAELTGSLA
uniref:Glyco_hydro_35 domain-containing protein n=1 Tax=Macrostomum lignano TaxID=282301 RepID=A0A1I8F8X2_9PLAT